VAGVSGANAAASVRRAVDVHNEAGAGPFVLACDHASNRIPERYGTLGLTAADRVRHIAWDPGALPVALRLCEVLDAPLVASTVSRLVIDCNRDHGAPDLIPVISERTSIPGNAEVTAEDRARRIAEFHTPFHAALDDVISRRLAAGQPTVLVTVHSFTPVYKDVWRPWPIGLIHGHDIRMTRALADALVADAPGLNLGWNEPYSALEGVTYTLEHHGNARGLDAAMIEIRHDEILEPDGIALWADRLARCLPIALGAIGGAARYEATSTGA
jgi:predicted N-formylglutamate amidohydrolase